MTKYTDYIKALDLDGWPFLKIYQFYNNENYGL